jgi:hypothetical protein
VSNELLDGIYENWGAKKAALKEATDPSATSSFSGFDYVTYMGNTEMTAWWNDSPFFYSGFYLAPAPNHTDTSYMTKRSYMASLGWGFLITYVGLQEGQSGLTFAGGEAAAVNATSLAKTAGFPKNAIIFLDIETGGTLTTSMLNYINGWATALFLDEYYECGVYCNKSSVVQVASFISPNPASFWCVNVNCTPSPGCTVPAPGALPPSGCGYGPALAWQFAESPEPAGTGCGNYVGGQCPQTYGGYKFNVDLDTSTAINPSNG